ncbi:MAG: hypothetical protein VW339_05070, partial [Quisquiliibacterium sp.]
MLRWQMRDTPAPAENQCDLHQPRAQAWTAKDLAATSGCSPCTMVLQRRHSLRLIWIVLAAALLGVHLPTSG